MARIPKNLDGWFGLVFYLSGLGIIWWLHGATTAFAVMLVTTGQIDLHRASKH